MPIFMEGPRRRESHPRRVGLFFGRWCLWMGWESAAGWFPGRGKNLGVPEGLKN